MARGGRRSKTGSGTTVAAARWEPGGRGAKVASGEYVAANPLVRGDRARQRQVAGL